MFSIGQWRDSTDRAFLPRRRSLLARLLLAVLLLFSAGPVSADIYGPYADFASAEAACLQNWNSNSYHWHSWNWCDDPGRFYHPPEPDLDAVGINVAWPDPGVDHRPRYLYYLDGGCPAGEVAGPDGQCAPADVDADAYARAINAGDPSTCNGGQGAAAVSMAAGNPVHVGTGNKYQREIDIAGWSPFAAPLVRHYNSRTTGRDGSHWRHTWQRHLAVDGFEYRDDAGELRTVDDTLALIRPDGRTLVFYRIGEHQLAAHAADTPADIPAVGTAQYPLHWTGDEWRFRNDTGALEYYDAGGRLRRIEDRAGFTQWIERDAAGRVQRVRDDFGRGLTFHYDGQGRLTRVDDPAGRSYGYGYDAGDRLISVTGPDGAMRTYHYGELDAPAGYLTGITDAEGRRFATWQYDDQGRAILSEHAGGAGRVEIEYLDDDRVRVTEAGGAEHTYDLTTLQGRKLATAIEGGACSSCAQGSAYEYDEQGLITRMTDRNGNVTTYQYDAAGLETRRTEAVATDAERTITTEWDSARRLPLAITEEGRRSEYSYDDRGRVLTETIVDTATGTRRTTTYTYHPTSNGVPGQLASIDGPRTGVSDVTRFAYDHDGNRVRVTNALGHVTRISEHDAHGRPLALVDANGLTTNLHYDVNGRLVEVSRGGRSTSLAHDAAGNLTRVTRPAGVSLAYEYDGAHRVTALEDERGNRIELTLDSRGNRTARHVTDASGEVVRAQQQVFDELGRLIERLGAQGQSTRHRYDDNGNRTRTTDPTGDATRRAFDALDRLIRQTDALGGVTRYAHDDHDRVTAVTDPNGNTTRYTYDGLGNRIRVDSPDSGLTSYQYDAAGNVIASTDARGKTTSYTYDALNRRTSATYADGSRVVYEWDSANHGTGRPARIVEESGTIAWTYNRHGDIVERRREAGETELTTTHEHDAAGRRTATVYPSGMSVEYEYAADRVTGIAVDGTPVLEDAHYAPFGPVAGWTWGDGDVHERSFDRDGRLVAHGMPDGQRTLAYSADGRITGISGPNVDNGYGYDALDRLTEAEGVGWSRRYTYDPNGNRLRRTADGTATDYTIAPDSNRLLATRGSDRAAYSYDAAGNMTGDGDHGYTYNARGRLAAVDGGDTAVYRYNALGQRVYKRRARDLPPEAAPAAKGNRRGGRLRGNNGIERRFAYDERGQLLGVYDARGRRVQEYVYLGRIPVAVVDRRGLHYIHADHLGTSRAVSEPNGPVVWRWHSDPFGTTSPDPNPDGRGGTSMLNLRFPGQYYDAETGTNYNYFRTYDPNVGRYGTSDPIGLTGGLNTYSYVGGNPISRTDPLGLEWQFMIGVSGSIGGNPYLPILSPFIGGGLNIGFTTSGQIIVQTQATGSLGVGIYGGVSVQGQVSRSNCSTPFGMSVQQALQGDFNFGAGPSVGGSIQYDPSSGSAGIQSGFGRLAQGRLGVGYGLQASAGVTQITTLATPALFPSKPSQQCGCP